MATGKKHKVFILSVGDEGAILTLTQGGKILHRSFSKKPIESNFPKVLAEHPRVPICILVDVLDQAYIRHTLPPVNAFNANKLIARKIQKDFNETDLKKYMLVRRDKSGRKEWHYLLISARFVSPLSDWVALINESPNRLTGIYMLPVEYGNLLSDIIKSEPKEKKKRHDDEWHIVVSHNRVGGFRQMVFQRRRIMFTRITQPVGGHDPEVIAGNIEQETLNTIEYIRRLGYKDNAPLSVYFVISEKVKNKLSARHFPNTHFASFTPHELAKQVDLPEAASPSDRFGDVLTAVHFACQKRHLLPLFTPEIQQIQLMRSVRIGLRIAATVALLAISAASYKGFNSYQAYRDDYNEYAEAKKHDQVIAERYQTFQTEHAADTQKTISLANIDKQLSRDQLMLFDFLTDYSELLADNILVESFDFDVTPPVKRDGNSHFNSRISLKFTAPANISADQLLDEIDLFVTGAERHFAQYEVTFDSLPTEQLMTLDLLDSSQSLQRNKEIIITMQIGTAKADPNQPGRNR